MPAYHICEAKFGSRERKTFKMEEFKSTLPELTEEKARKRCNVYWLYAFIYPKFLKYTPLPAVRGNDNIATWPHDTCDFRYKRDWISSMLYNGTGDTCIKFAVGEIPAPLSLNLFQNNV